MTLFSRMPPRLSDDVQAVVDIERVVVRQSDGVRARMLARARAALRHGDAAPAVAAPRRTPVFRRAAVALAASIVLATGIASAFRLTRRPTLPTAASQDSLQAERAPGRTVVRPRDTATSAVPSRQEMGTVAIVDSVTTSDASGRARSRPGDVERLCPRAPRHDRTGDEMRELRLLDRARRADATGDHEAVLAAVAEHERHCPTGRLVEERDVLRVKALVSLDRKGDARRAVARFHRQFPRSVLSQKLDDMLAAMP